MMHSMIPFAVSPLVTAMFGKRGAQPINVTRFNGVDGKAAVENYTFTGPFRIETTLVPEGSGVRCAFELTSVDYETQFLALRNTGTNWKISTMGHTPGQSSNNIVSDRIQKVAVEWSGTELRYYLNDALDYAVTPADATWLAGEFKVQWGYSPNNGASHLGEVLRGSIYDLTLPEEDQLVRDYDFSRTDDIVENKAPSGKKGPDLYSAPTTTHTNPEWEVLGGGLYRRTSDGGWGGTPNNMSAVDEGGAAYLLRVKMHEHLGGTARVYGRKDDDSGNTVLTSVPTDGTWLTILHAPLHHGGNRPLWIDSTDFSGTLEMYLYRVEGWGTMHGNPTVTKYLEVDDGDLVNVQWPNLITYSNKLHAWGTGANTSVGPVETREGFPTTMQKLEIVGDTSCQLFHPCPKLEVGKKYTISLYTEEGTWDGNFQLAYYDGSTQVAGGSIYLPSGKGRPSVTFTVGTDATDPQIRIVGWNTTASIGTYCYAGGVQVEEGPIPTKLRKTVNEAGVKIPASDLYKLRKRIARLLEQKKGSKRPIYKFLNDSNHGSFPAWTASGDFEVITRQNGKHGYVVSGPVARIFNHLDYFKFGRYIGDNTQGPLNIAPDGKLSEYKAARYNNDTHLFINGKPTDTLARSGDRTGDYAFDRIGVRWDDAATSVPSYSGYLQQVALIDLDNPLTNSRLYLMDDATGILYDALNPLGANLALGLPYVKAGGCTLEGSIITGTNNSWAYLGKDVVTEIGKTYVVKVKGITSTGATYWSRAFDMIGLANIETKIPINSGETAEYLFTAVSALTRVYLQHSSNLPTGETLEAIILDVREALNTGTMEGFDPNVHAPVFEYQGPDSKEWLGKELWNNGPTGDIPPLTTVNADNVFLEEGHLYRFGDTSLGNVFANNGLGWNQPPNTDFTHQVTRIVQVRNLSGDKTALSFTPTFREVLKEA